MIELDASGLREKIDRTLRLFDVAETQAVALATYFVTVLKARTPKKSGKTAESWTVNYHKVAGSIIWEIVPEGKEKEVTYLEFGTKPHVILPKDGSALRFEIAGEIIFASKVYHPGTKPLGFVRLTQDDLDKSAREIGERLLHNIQHVWG